MEQTALHDSLFAMSCQRSQRSPEAADAACMPRIAQLLQLCHAFLCPVVCSSFIHSALTGPLPCIQAGCGEHRGDPDAASPQEQPLPRSCFVLPVSWGSVGL